MSRVLVAAPLILSPLALLGCEALTPAPTAPAPPALAELPSETRATAVVLRGATDPNTAIVVNDEELRPRGPGSAFSLSLPLAAGDNEFVVVAVDAAGRRSAPVGVNITRDVSFPATPRARALPPRTQQETLAFVYDVDADASCDLVIVDGAAATVDRDGAWTADVALDLGKNTVRAACVDDERVEGVLAIVDVERVDSVPVTLCADAGGATCTPLPTTAALGSTLALSARCDDDVVLAIGNDEPTACVDGVWAAPRTLTVPVDVAVFAGFAGDPGSLNDEFPVVVDAAD